MQNVNIYNDRLFLPGNFKYKQVNKLSKNVMRNNLLPCITKTRKILNNLEESLKKSYEYEEKLQQCKRNHYYVNGRDTETLEPTKTDYSVTNLDKTKSTRNQIDIVESWSTTSVVCLQYQYEELSKRYESLLHAYEQRCDALNARDTILSRLRKRVHRTHAELAGLHRSLIAIGEKYLSLKYKKMTQCTQYKHKIQQLKHTVAEVLVTVERTRAGIARQIAECVSMEHDAAVALLLVEIKRCNFLALENLYLKTKIEELSLNS